MTRAAETRRAEDNNVFVCGAFRARSELNAGGFPAARCVARQWFPGSGSQILKPRRVSLMAMSVYAPQPQGFAKRYPSPFIAGTPLLSEGFAAMNEDHGHASRGGKILMLETALPCPALPCFLSRQYQVLPRASSPK